jgi:hypothetical protein
VNVKTLAHWRSVESKANKQRVLFGVKRQGVFVNILKGRRIL